VPAITATQYKIHYAGAWRRCKRRQAVHESLEKFHLFTALANVQQLQTTLHWSLTNSSSQSLLPRYLFSN